MKKQGLSNRQNEILTFIKKYMAKHGYSPSVREIATGVHLSSPATVHVHIQNLIEKGFLKRGNSNHKLLELLVPNEFELHEGEAIGVPFLNQFVGKDYLDYLEHPDEYFYLSSQMVLGNSDVFVIKVFDDSMYNIGIYENDYVVVGRNQKISNGDVVVALDDTNHLIVRTFYQDIHYVRLQPENDLLPPIVLTEATILGKVISLYRQF